MRAKPPQTQGQPQTPGPAPEKKDVEPKEAYEQPELVLYGSINEMTATVARFSF